MSLLYNHISTTGCKCLHHYIAFYTIFTATWSPLQDSGKEQKEGEDILDSLQKHQVVLVASLDIYVWHQSSCTAQLGLHVLSQWPEESCLWTSPRNVFTLTKRTVLDRPNPYITEYCPRLQCLFNNWLLQFYAEQQSCFSGLICLHAQKLFHDVEKEMAFPKTVFV